MGGLWKRGQLQRLTCSRLFPFIGESQHYVMTLKQLLITTNSESVCNSRFIVAVNSLEFASNLVRHYSDDVENVCSAS